MLAAVIATRVQEMSNGTSHGASQFDTYHNGCHDGCGGGNDGDAVQDRDLFLRFRNLRELSNLRLFGAYIRRPRLEAERVCALWAEPIAAGVGECYREGGTIPSFARPSSPALGP